VASSKKEVGVEITEVKISLREGGNKKLKAYTTVTFDDCFVVRNIKVIEGNSGLFVAMPARKMKQFCPRCGKKIDLKSRYCSQCGTQLPPAPRDMDQTKASQIHQDIAHPINQQFRDYLQKKVLDAYHQEKAKAPESTTTPEANLDTHEENTSSQEEL
jgi:stage V sporulation protein G